MEAYWTHGDQKDVEKAQTFEELLIVALRIIKRIPYPISMVCGPISTGGCGSIEENLTVFNKAIEALREKNITVFSQMPFEEPMLRIIKETPYYKNGEQLLNIFYLPLFESGYVKTLYFIPDWASSFGASWEHEQAKRLGIAVVYLKTDEDQ